MTLKLCLRSAVLLCSLVFISLSYAAPAPDFTLKDAQGKNVRLGELRGKVVMLNFWASWCGPCRQEMPLLDKINDRYRKAGLMFYGVNVEQDNAAAKKMIADLGVNLPILYDPDSKVSKLYKVDAMPTTVVIDKNGEVRFVNRGYKAGDENKYRDQIRELIRE